jgi:hypothetical protein
MGGGIMSDRIDPLKPSAALLDGERVLQEFHPDRSTYWRDHAWMAALAMAGGMLILWMLGNAHVWTGAVGGLAAIAIRAWYVASDELAVRWDLTDRRLLGPAGRAIKLGDIDKLNVLGSAVQVVTRGGDKHLMKYQADRDATRTRIKSAMGNG